MGANFTEFGDLVLLIGDFYIPQRAVDLPVCFRELLNTDKIRHILCTGNVGSSSVVESLRSISSSLHIVKGDCDQDFDFPEYKVLQFGDFRIGLIHGHQIVPWGDGGSLLHWQRKLDCDILVYGHLHKDSVIELEGKFFINPGSATGAYQPWITEKVPSFMLMAVQGSSVVLYVYEEKGGKAEVVMSEFKKESSSSSTAHATSSSSSSAMGDMNSNSSSSMNNSSSSSHSTSNGSASSSIHH